MKNVYLSLSPYECGCDGYCKLQKSMNPVLRMKSNEMFGIGSPIDAPKGTSLVLNYNPGCNLGFSDQALAVRDICMTCSKCTINMEAINPYPELTHRSYRKFNRYDTKHGLIIETQPYTPNMLVFLTSYNERSQRLVLPDFLKVKSNFEGHIKGNYYNWEVLTIKNTNFNFGNLDENTPYFSNVVRAIAMRDKLVIKR